jgi:hypothetical protein
MQGLTIRVARRINKTLGRRGKVFVDRYFETVVKSLKQARNCLCYVLLNAQRHAAQSGMRCEPGWIDPCSSGRYFDGWRGLRVRPPPDEEPCRPSGMASSSGTSRDELGSPSALAGPALEEPTVSEPHTWILSTGWRRYGLIPLDALPGRRRGSR